MTRTPHTSHSVQTYKQFQKRQDVLKINREMDLNEQLTEALPTGAVIHSHLYMKTSVDTMYTFSNVFESVQIKEHELEKILKDFLNLVIVLDCDFKVWFNLFV